MGQRLVEGQWDMAKMITLCHRKEKLRAAVRTVSHRDSSWSSSSSQSVRGKSNQLCRRSKTASRACSGMHSQLSMLHPYPSRSSYHQPSTGRHSLNPHRHPWPSVSASLCFSVLGLGVTILLQPVLPRRLDRRFLAHDRSLPRPHRP